MEEVGNSNPVFLIIHKKAAIRSYLCSAFQKRSFLPLKQQKTMKNALFFMVFCLAAFSSAIMAAPDRACPCGAKLSAPLRARTSARERVRGSQRKKKRFAVPHSFLSLAPDRACPCGAKFGGRGCRHRPPHRTSVLSAGAAKTRHSACYTAVMAAPDRLELTPLRLTAECSTD